MAVRARRHLAAVLSADVVGYSRLIGQDEEGTLTALRKLRGEVFEPAVAEHDGAIVKRMGDGWLVEFVSVVDAVKCAIAIQEGQSALVLRIGIHSGDVVHDDEDIYGDGVNIASRLQELAPSGGIALSETARRSLDAKLSGNFTDGGARELKNIAEPVRVFLWGDLGDEPAIEASQPVGDTGWSSIAVRSFTIVGNAAEHAYLAGAVSDSIVSALSHFQEFAVVAPDGPRPAQFTLTGSMQIAGLRLRISTQLTDEINGRHLWSEKFDRELDDVFALQDEISAIVAAFLGEAVWREATKSLAGKDTSQFTTGDWILRSMQHIHQLDRENNARARAAIDQALAIDPTSYNARMVLGFCCMLAGVFGFTNDRAAALSAARDMARELLAENEAIANTQRLMARTLSALGEHVEARSHAERALQINPYDSDILICQAHVLQAVGAHSEAIEWIEKALRYSPSAPAYYGISLGVSRFLLGDIDAALPDLRRVDGAGPTARIWLASALATAGSMVEAKAQIDEILVERPGFTLADVGDMFGYFARDEDREKLLNGLALAGLEP